MGTIVVPLNIDLLIAVSWAYDEEFVTLLEKRAKLEGVSTLVVRPATLESAVMSLRKAEWKVCCGLDRASDEMEAFLEIHRTASEGGDGIPPEIRWINPLHYIPRAANKAEMHLALQKEGIDIPHSLMVPPSAEKESLPLTNKDLEGFAKPFIVKPAITTGGGLGVVLDAMTLDDIVAARQRYSRDTYLVQETIRPAYLGYNKAWFRNFFAFGETFLCWWDDRTHAFRSVTAIEEERYELERLRRLMERIADVCKLDFFSSEIAITRNERVVVVDYVNEICDMRLQSLHPDGVPDHVVVRICDALVGFVRTIRNGNGKDSPPASQG